MNWGNINSELDYLLQDVPISGQAAAYSADLRVNCFNRAQEFFAVTHTAPIKTTALTTFTTWDEDGVVATLPTDLIQIGGIKVEGVWLTPNQVVAGESTTTGWTQINKSQVYFGNVDQDDAVLWYYAHYTKMVNDNDTCGLPQWAEWPVLNLTIAYILTPNAVSQAIFRQYQTKREAGEPESNPPREQALYHLKAYYDEVTKVRPQDRESLYK